MDKEQVDWGVVETLLNVIHGASAAGPKFIFIAALANDELMAYLAPPKAEEPVAEQPQQPEEPTDE